MGAGYITLFLYNRYGTFVVQGVFLLILLMIIVVIPDETITKFCQMYVKKEPFYFC
jgi:ABC-type phosphate/phosphonate transport system permease subunit